ncbi:MAG TPA: TIGR00303 family protein [Leptolyngbyaceae cyanobacterium]
MNSFVRHYTQPSLAADWLSRFTGQLPALALVLGFTETGLIPGISAAGATPEDRRLTALADAEFLLLGNQAEATFPLPPLQAGVSPAVISRAVVAAQNIPVHIFDAGLPREPSVPHVDLGGLSAQCLSSGKALPLATVEHLWRQGLWWGEQLAQQLEESYLILGECVVGGTTTALAILTALGIAADGQVNSSHPVCNHQQKRSLVQAGLKQAEVSVECANPLALVAAVGDPMQPVVAGMALAASRSIGVLLAGGTQMLAVYALMTALAKYYTISWQPSQVVVGTTRWVAEDSTGDTVGLAKAVDACLMATPLSFANSRFPQLQVYEQGFVKEGVAAGGCAIAAHLYQGWNQAELLNSIEELLATQLG